MRLPSSIKANKWGGALFVLFAIAIGVTACTESIYPKDLSRNKAAYEKLVQLTLACCSDGDHMAILDNYSSPDPERAALMRQLGIDVVHYYPGNDVHPGAVVYLERDLWGPLSAMYVYSVDGGPKRIVGCYTSKHIRGHWYRSHSLPCLLM